MAYFFRDGRGTVGKTQHPDLFGSKPRRHCAGVLFKQQRDRAFVAAHRRAVNDVRTRFLPIFVDIVHIETLRQEHIDLNGYERVFLSVHVFDLNIEFRTIERSLVDSLGIRHLQIVKDTLHFAFGVRPLFGIVDIFVVGIFGVPARETIRHVFVKPDAF